MEQSNIQVWLGPNKHAVRSPRDAISVSAHSDAKSLHPGLLPSAQRLGIQLGTAVGYLSLGLPKLANDDEVLPMTSLLALVPRWAVLMR
jgi:hypothetical protein